MMIPFVVKSKDLYYNLLNGSLAKSDIDLKKKRFFDDRDVDELIKSTRVPKVRGNLEKISTVTIFTTTNCNARCSYCYEKGIFHRSMSHVTALDVANWISNRTSDVHLRWFGGEPFLNKDVIHTICHGLQEKGIKYRSTAISNGYFMTSIPVSWHLKRVQITIDGLEETYSKEKGIPLSVVLRRIHNAIDDGIKIVVRLNVTHTNVSELLEVCDILVEEPGLTAYAHEVFEDNPNYLGTNLVAKRLLDLGISADTKLPRYRDIHCMADGGTSVCINPEGKLTLCEHYCDDEIFGSIYNDDYNWDVIKSWREFIPQNEECKECFYRPVCHKLKKCHGDEVTCSKEYREFKYREIQQKMEAIAKKAGVQNGLSNP